MEIKGKYIGNKESDLALLQSVVRYKKELNIQYEELVRVLRTRLAKKLSALRKKVRYLERKKAKIEADKNLISKLNILIEHYTESLKCLQQDALDLALDTAKEIVDVEFKTNYEVLLEKIRSQVPEIIEKRKATFYVNPLDVDLIRSFIANFEEFAVEIKPKETVARYDLQIKTNSGIVVISWQEEWELMKDYFKGALAEQQKDLKLIKA